MFSNFISFSRCLTSVFLFVICLTNLDTAIALEAGQGKPTVKAGQDEAPEFLYHWTHDLVGFAKSVNKEGQLKLTKNIPEGDFLLHTVKTLEKMPALFAWSHPVTGMAYEASEFPPDGAQRAPGYDVYGHNLLVLKLKNNIPKQRILSIESNDKDSPEYKTKLENIWLVKHTHWQTTSTDRWGETKKIKPRIVFEEWIIINPAAISDLTADLYYVRRILLPEYKFAVNPKNKYKDSDRHVKLKDGFPNTDFARENVVLPHLTEYGVHLTDERWKSYKKMTIRSQALRKLYRKIPHSCKFVFSAGVM